MAGFEDRDRSAAGARLDREHRARELAQHLVVVRIALGMGLDAGAAVGAIQSRLDVRRQVLGA